MDASFLKLLRERNPAALTAIVQEHARPLHRMACAMGFTEVEAEDLAQEVFVVFLSTLDRFEGRSQVRTWLFGILLQKMRERRRALQREQSFDPGDAEFDALFTAYGHWKHPLEDLERTLESREIGRKVGQCLSLLPMQQREVFLLKEVEGIDSKEICNNLQISVTHLGVLMHRARQRLRECLKKKGWG